jgi:hypothetical protein
MTGAAAGDLYQWLIQGAQDAPARRWMHMPTDSREIAFARQERWLIRGLRAFQIIAGPAIWLLLIWVAYRVAVWIASVVVATGVDRTTAGLTMILLASAAIIWLVVGRRGDQGD